MKLNQILSSAIVCGALALFVGCGDSGPVGQEAANPPAEEGSDTSSDDTTPGSDNEG